MKKIIAFVMATLMIVGCVATFASCGKKTDFEKIEKNGKFVCGITIYEPMNYYEADGTTLTGFDTELAQLVAAKLGVDVEFQIIDWGNKYAELSAGSIDCIWNGFTSNSKDADGVDRSEKVDFSYAYLDNKQCVIVKADRLGEFTSAAALAGKKAGAENGSAGESYAQGAGATIEASKPSQLAVFTELNSGAVDFIVVDKLLADEIVGKGDYAGLAVVSAIDIEPEVYSIGCRKGSDFDEKINEALVELLNEGKIEELAAKYGVRVTDSLMAMKTAK